MALYELRTYTLYVGKMAEGIKLYQEFGFPALEKGGHDEKLVGYFQADTGMINQLVHLWKFDDDGDRRKHWAAVYASKDFMEGFASKMRPLIMSAHSGEGDQSFRRMATTCSDRWRPGWREGAAG
jgi:NIPSNAP protein